MASTEAVQNIRRKAKPVPLAEARIQCAIARIAESDCPVLILGEHGSGKRSTAVQIHAHSSRSRKAFKEIHSSAASAQSLLADLSGGGTIYLSEITDLDLALQDLIISAYFRSGRAQNCRLLFGSSRELSEAVKSWRMREDFCYLISAVTLRIPPLRYRKTEILLIADDLLTRYARQFDRPKPVLCPEIIEHLMDHTWPDNLPELETAIKTFVAIGDQAISLAAIKAAAQTARPGGARRPLLLKEATRASSIQIERQLISEVLASTGGNRKRAAIELGISYKALLYKLKQIETENRSAFDRNGVAQ
ncbi:MAG: sigma-54-dependent transcriptional regulator [Terracidiphilus sp.]